jgi:hypothetical protein
MTQQIPGTDTRSDSADGITPTTLAYLFADRFSPSEKAGRSGMQAFGTGGVVVTKDLAAILLGIAIWQLREDGAVTLEAYREKKLGFISVHGVRVRLTGSAARSGLDQRVLAYLERSRKARERGESAWDIANMLCRDGKNPWSTIISMAIEDAVAAGYLAREQQDVGVVGRLAGKPKAKLVAVGERIAPLDEAARGLAKRWSEFRTTESELAKELTGTIYDGLSTRDRSERGSDLGD